MKKNTDALNELIRVMAKLRSPGGCPWDREQTHKSIRFYLIEEAYELLDAIEAEDDHEMAEELGDLLLHVIFHCQLARERGAFDFEKVAKHVTEKLIRRHPHVFGETKVKNIAEVWSNWEQIKKAEKHGTKHARPSALDGIPKHLPALLRAEKLVKKARRGKLIPAGKKATSKKSAVAKKLFALAQTAEAHGWSAEELLREQVGAVEKNLRKLEQKKAAKTPSASKN
ncbi:MAG: nucleoside triphosphate pyrophosphohydrolase [Verrucomicrobiales bacterium]|nr:nucleoside triphosphate pyrophosphohydrolase [Verrucomicrobiales bacterium]